MLGGFRVRLLSGGTCEVEVGGPSFGVDELTDHTGLKAGSTVSEPVHFTNVANRPARGVQTVLALSPGLDFADRYSNCEYGNIGKTHYSECCPKCAIDLGETAALAAPVRLRVNSAALSTLALKVKAGRKSSAPAGSVSLPQAGNVTDYRIVSLRARNTAGFGVTGASAQAGAGRNATFAFRLSVNGPATLFDRSDGDGVPTVWVTLPTGTTAVGHSANCSPWQLHNPTAAAHAPYICFPPGIELPKGQVTELSLTVRVDQPVAPAKGGVLLVRDFDPAHSQWLPFDPNGGNDSAALTLN
ncbi:hypothetical protein AV521_18935 [Streptomyces sp. IMTB 2501]|uniref:hypothetical protein n=1 Tax=Streptomyces sp. IMTB 2501 TaxID=1776340 RepID=UPI00096E3C1D|nr:hypothetical protein [Streptomyces sp. IMTB 2501]OLZ68882.1 hypothetical protein AV521_18935 [Streptomyces sp. IMTB 2501]